MRIQTSLVAASAALAFAAFTACGGSTDDSGGEAGAAGADGGVSGASAGTGGSSASGGAGTTGGSSGIGGTAGGAGLAGAAGVGGVDGGACPLDLFGAIGEPCAPEGRSCGGQGCTDPCQFCNVLRCEGGVWQRLEAFPDPNCNDAGGATCGGEAGDPCGPNEYCEFGPDGTHACGGDDGVGVCRQRPVACTGDCPGACGCDGKFYCNACGAQAAGHDTRSAAGCTDGGGPGDACGSDIECGAGLKCCYPCGIPGCTNQCMAPDPGGQCPLFP